MSEIPAAMIFTVWCEESINLRCCLLAFGRVRLGMFTFVMAETAISRRH
jgi:hypothetical protein